MINYEKLAANYAAHRTVHPQVVRALIEKAQLTSQSTVLEVGCGTGNYLHALAQEVDCRCWGIDPSAAMLSQMHTEPGEIDSQIGTAEQITFEDNRFDLVYSVDVIHHVTDTNAAFAEMLRVLNGGGRVCTVTDSEDIIRKRRPLSLYFPDSVAVDLSRYPPLTTLQSTMTRTGFVEHDRQLVHARSQLTDIQKYRDRAFSCLHLISDDSFLRGIAAMEQDLRCGPIECESSYALLWGTKPHAAN